MYKNSQVFCNSYYLGKRPSGYVSFSYDISGQALFGSEENEISVKVVHNDLTDSRWFTGSGITKKVTVLIEEPVHPAEYGCTFRTEEISGEGNRPCAHISVIHRPVNDSGQALSLKTRTVLLDAQGGISAECTGEIRLSPGEHGSLTLSGYMESPHLWSPESPYLYRMQVWYRVNEGTAYLTDEEKVGIRSIAFVPDEGFFLNGVS